MDALDVGGSNARLKQGSHAFDMRLPASQRTDIEGVGAKRGDECRVSIFASWLSTATAVEASSPIRSTPHPAIPAGSDIAETLFRGEGRARVHDHHVVAERARHRDQRLRHMHRADDHEPFVGLNT